MLDERVCLWEYHVNQEAWLGCGLHLIPRSVIFRHAPLSNWRGGRGEREREKGKCGSKIPKMSTNKILPLLNIVGRFGVNFQMANIYWMWHTHKCVYTHTQYGSIKLWQNILFTLNINKTIDYIWQRRKRRRASLFRFLHLNIWTYHFDTKSLKSSEKVPSSGNCGGGPSTTSFICSKRLR